MKVSKLLNDVEKFLLIGEDVDVTSLSNKSKGCKKNCLFFCIDGINNDGSKFVQEAILNGAVCVVSNKKLKVNVTQVIVDDVRSCMSLIAKNFYGNACDKLKIIGITGTNGKTTSSFIIQHILNVAGFSVGVIGTNGVFIDNKLISEDLTTPDPIELHYYFKEMKKSNCDFVIMEASAHAICLKKLVGIKFRVGLFTNITNEHLDFFGNMKNYSKCKLSFFKKENVDEAVFNVDNAYGRLLAKLNQIPNITYGIYNPSNTFAINIETSFNGSKFFVNSLDSIFDIKTNLIGEHNVYNILGAISVCKLLNIRDEYILKGVNTLLQVDGRCNVTKLNNNNYIIVDFAHTPDGFEKILGVFRKLVKGKLITIFGCVEYSDTKKRVLMGKVASAYSDYIILTADNPNNTSVFKINRDIKAGFKKFKNYTEIEDRKKAIEYGISLLCKNDALIILGKGGEHKQLIMGNAIKYNEQEVVNNLLNS